MEGIDTNVLIRFLVKDDLQQYQQALSLFIGMPKVYLSPIVLVETVWVLSHFYQVKRLRQCEILKAFICQQGVVTDDRQAVMAALDDYEQGYDFADAMIGHYNLSHQCKKTWTFDRKASRLPAFSLIQPDH
ncbi:PIN domain-containing protein [Endozoicomonas sp. ALD040]|uniref:PIN domain-containing protein n=1 Tax=Endozoicomonas sp. ALD040 TaxID=3403079 RepID=UPI003BB18E19